MNFELKLYPCLRPPFSFTCSKLGFICFWFLSPHQFFRKHRLLPMIEYLNAIAVVLLLFIPIVSLVGREGLYLQRISEGVEPLKNVLDFVGNLPKWLNYYHNLNANVQCLRERKTRLQHQMEDLVIRVKQEEHQTGRSRNNQVRHWISSVETKDREVSTLLEETNRETNYFSKYLYRAWLGSHVEKKIQEVDDLYNSGIFENVLSHAIEPLELMVKPLVGRNANESIGMILEWLENHEVTKIGIHGREGMGKTAIMMHVHNQLLRNSNLSVYMIQVSEVASDYDLQSLIAEAINLDLREESLIKRAAFLNRALRRKKFVLILDGLNDHFGSEDVGIPRGHGKMIISSRSPTVCRIMGCQSIELVPLSDDEAMELFTSKLDLPLPLEPRIQVVATHIVRQCQGVADIIEKKAIELRKVEDPAMWERYLNEMLIVAN